MATIIIHSNVLNFDQVTTLTRALGKPEKHTTHYRIERAEPPAPETLDALRNALQLDINVLPEDFDPKAVKLLISDMDSTLIAIECVDEIADRVGIKDEVAAITEAAMRGELDFESSLKKRVGLLEGLPTHELECVYEERLELNPGAETLIAGLKQKGISFALVSGGFTFFTERLKAELGLDFARANVLAVAEGKLTGGIDGDIVAAHTKAEYLLELCDQLGITPQQAIAVGDGANDLEMMKLAGLSVAYHAKPAVRTQADTQLNIRGLDAILDFLEA
ncbi:phosphoserine phosphatase [Sulfurivirga caldicuralii]|uniref:Phosphoserine phosphatase n=1 Tax=Sulfurivirga caldicuralii TaxID=364032 RepID=A0A1N6ELK9_9GAMM|nr:phosphoserine phosphatase SerB [Sulfurivirga caldicuralii]SIN83837.1 phosphoserine phosphatase [Sulfurivirga caldicuralii]